MTAPHRPVRLILDTSALLTYLTGSVHVAEPVHEVVESRVAFGVPAVAAAEALALIDDAHDRALLMRLLQHRACAVLDTDGRTWHELAYWHRATGRPDLAACAMAALDHDAAVLTADGKLYGGVPVIDIEQL
ncbi:PIN domain-containing protein [Micromonospora sp. DT233]|uniref:PIN domain-containing protein n=1 Tax=Micromonospora sp. DT233 TaxID=3393432 RepID=UPI003CEBEDBA